MCAAVETDAVSPVDQEAVFKDQKVLDLKLNPEEQLYFMSACHVRCKFCISLLTENFLIVRCDSKHFKTVSKRPARLKGWSGLLCQMQHLN